MKAKRPHGHSWKLNADGYPDPRAYHDGDVIGFQCRTCKAYAVHPDRPAAPCLRPLWLTRAFQAGALVWLVIFLVGDVGAFEVVTAGAYFALWLCLRYSIRLQAWMFQ